MFDLTSATAQLVQLFWEHGIAFLAGIVVGSVATFAIFAAKLIRLRREGLI